ncbi:hypothetical protein M8C21_029523 [Ambrosia artemisiifolia]|uniref:Armadillo-like repeats domain-containing protein n=1 Tax=Ambrosia artemisiifolia TaxID=4212 RepID=A0AAD5D0W1_AMBAR|nr:hypothetical protein M8C21_029523 [Ambrosia artemisiifolia]
MVMSITSCGHHYLFCNASSSSSSTKRHPPPSSSKLTITNKSTLFLYVSLSPQLNTIITTTTFNIRSLLLLSSSPSPLRPTRLLSSTVPSASTNNNTNPNHSDKKDQEEVIEEDLPWIQEKALDIVEFSGSVTQTLPGPRVGRSSFPWLLALPLAYVGLSFVIALLNTLRNFTSPKHARRRLVSKNAELCRSIDDLLDKETNGVQQQVLKELMHKTGFSMVEILRKYIRYSLNEKPFDPKLVAALIQLRKATMLDDSQVAEILNEVSRRIVKDFGPVVMNTSGYSEKGLRRKLAVQALFGKILYLSELPEFCARDSSLIVKEIFGVADEDAERLRLHTVAEAGDMDSLEKMVVGVDSEPDSEDSGED